MAHRRSHAVIDSNFLVGVNDVEPPSCPSPVQPFSGISPKSAFKARRQRNLSIDIPPDDFASYCYGADTKDGEPAVPSSCVSVAHDDALALMRHMSITPRSNSNGSNSGKSFTPVKPKTPEPSVPLFLVSSWETPAILKNDYQILGILGK